GVNQASGFDRDRRGRRGLRSNALLLRRERQSERQQRSSERRRSPHYHLLRGSVDRQWSATTSRPHDTHLVVRVFLADRGSEIHFEPDLLLPVRELGLRLAELRRLQAALEAREVVGIEQVEGFPESGCRQTAAELEDLADAEVHRPVVVAAARSAGLGPR